MKARRREEKVNEGRHGAGEICNNAVGMAPNAQRAAVRAPATLWHGRRKWCVQM